MPSMPRASRTWASGTCSCSSAPTSRSTRPICRARPVTASASCRGSSASSTRQCPASRSRSSGRDPFHGLAGDQAEPDVRELRGDGDEPRGGLQQVRRDEGGDDHGADATPHGGPGQPSSAARRLATAGPPRLPGMNVVFVDPAFPPTQRQFVRALAEVGADGIGVGDRPGEWLDDELRAGCRTTTRSPTSSTSARMTDAVRWIQDKVWVDRLEATIEAHTLAAAQVRENCTIPGTSVRTAWLCRDKPSMKEVLRAAGVPTAASTAASTAEEVRDFARAVGYPLILKPRSGAGALDTTRVDDDGELDAALGAVRRPAGRLDRRRGVRRGARGLLRHPVGRRRPGARLRVPLLPERARGDADPLDLAAVRRDQPGRLGGRLPAAARAWGGGSTRRSGSAPAPRTWSGSSGPRG